MKTWLIVLLMGTCAVCVNAADPLVTRDVDYAETNHPRQTLDVYQPAGKKNCPVVIWIHGGAWRFGDKKAVQEKPKAFNEKGYVFVSVNYRFVPQVAMDDMASDVAKAIQYVHKNADQYGGDAERLFVAGHSAGAHLAALVCTDHQYLNAQGRQLSDIAGCVPVDTAVYDAAKQISDFGRIKAAMYVAAFGKEIESHKRFSPVTHVSEDKGIPPFLILHVADRSDSTAQSNAFAAALSQAGVDASVVVGKNKTHATINQEMGLPGDACTTEVFCFLDALSKKTAAE